MKTLAVFVLVAFSISSAWGGKRGGRDGWSTYEWSTNKALETCYGKPVMDLYNVNVKSRKAKCSGLAAPELELPMFRAPRRFVQNLLDGAKDKEDGTQRMMRKWMAKSGVMEQMENDDNMELTISFPGWVMLKIFKSLMVEGKRADLLTKVLGDADAFKRAGSMGARGPKRQSGFMRRMLDNPYDSDRSMKKGRPDFDNDDHIEDFIRSAADLRGRRSSSRHGNQGPDFDDDDDIEDFIRSAADMINLASSSRRRNKRATSDIEDKLVEKLQAEEEKMKMKMGNCSCYMREMKAIDADGNIDLDAYFEEQDTYPKEDQLLKENTKKMAKSCYEQQQSKESSNDLTFDEKLGKAKKFMCCVERGWKEVCMKRDVRMKLEENFGSISTLMEDTGMDQETLLSLAQRVIM